MDCYLIFRFKHNPATVDTTFRPCQETTACNKPQRQELWTWR